MTIPVTIVSSASSRRSPRTCACRRSTGAASACSSSGRWLLSSAEDEWNGQEVAVGDAVVRVVGPVPRWCVRRHAPDTGVRSHDMLRTILLYRGARSGDDLETPVDRLPDGGKSRLRLSPRRWRRTRCGLSKTRPGSAIRSRDGLPLRGIGAGRRGGDERACKNSAVSRRLASIASERRGNASTAEQAPAAGSLLPGGLPTLRRRACGATGVGLRDALRFWLPLRKRAALLKPSSGASSASWRPTRWSSLTVIFTGLTSMQETSRRSVKRVNAPSNPGQCRSQPRSWAPRLRLRLSDYVDDTTVAHSNAVAARLVHPRASFLISLSKSACYLITSQLRLQANASGLSTVIHVARWLAPGPGGNGAPRPRLRPTSFSGPPTDGSVVADWLRRANVSVLCCTHTGLPFAEDFTVEGHRYLVINNGSVGLPCFSEPCCGVMTRLSGQPDPPPDSLYGTRIGRLRCDALPVEAHWTARFLEQWPAGSPGHDAYLHRLRHGTPLRLEQAARGTVDDPDLLIAHGPGTRRDLLGTVAAAPG